MNRIYLLTNTTFKATIKFTMNNIQTGDWQTFNTTDVRFRLGRILTELQRRRKPVLIISRSKPKAWLYPYEQKGEREDLFGKWYTEVLPKYSKVKAQKLITLIRRDREQR